MKIIVLLLPYAMAKDCEDLKLILGLSGLYSLRFSKSGMYGDAKEFVSSVQSIHCLQVLTSVVIVMIWKNSPALGVMKLLSSPDLLF